MVCKGPPVSNLHRFLDWTTPRIQPRILKKSETVEINRLWNRWEGESVEYFQLGDLWNQYDEWSAYGAGVPVTLRTGENIVQYFVPYLSAIQIYTSGSHPGTLSGSLREDLESGDGDMEASFSDSCSEESEAEKTWRSDGTSSSSSDARSEHDCVKDRLGQLYFQFFERSTPYGRAPLMDMICLFSRRFPGLLSLRSVDLSPASWMAVAWYPIYHIPVGRMMRDLSACFLTYHTLSACFQDVDFEDEKKNISRERKGSDCIALPPFGLATYKMQGDVWFSGDGGRCGGAKERLTSLLNVADSWLKQLDVQHHDFNYFLGVRHG